MNSLLSSNRNALKRSIGLIPTYLFGNTYKLNRPLMLHAPWYGKNNDENGKDSNSETRDPSQVKDTASGRVNMRIVSVPHIINDYDERNTKIGRPVSPHLSIYKKQLTSVMSIMLRISGLMLGVGIWVIGLSGLFLDKNINDLADQIELCDCSPTFFKALKFAIILPFAYHAVAGTRHLSWTFNVFLTKKEIYATGYLALLLTFLLASSLAIVDVQSDPGTSSENEADKVLRPYLEGEYDEENVDSNEECFEEYEVETECVCQEGEQHDDR